MYVCVYVHVRTCMNNLEPSITRVKSRNHVAGTCMYACMYVCICEGIYECMYVCICSCTCMHNNLEPKTTIAGDQL
jgi:hypothetical protein